MLNAVLNSPRSKFFNASGIMQTVDGILALNADLNEQLKVCMGLKISLLTLHVC